MLSTPSAFKMVTFGVVSKWMHEHVGAINYQFWMVNLIHYEAYQAQNCTSFYITNIYK